MQFEKWFSKKKKEIKEEKEKSTNDASSPNESSTPKDAEKASTTSETNTATPRIQDIVTTKIRYDDGLGVDTIIKY